MIRTIIEVPIHGRFAFTITVLSNEELDRNPGRAKRATNNGPVFIAEDGRQAYVLLTMEEYLRIGGKRGSIVDLLAMPEMAEIDPDFEYPRMGAELLRPVDWF